MSSGNEFDLIARYFTRSAPAGMLGVGDDCALLPVAQGRELAISTDMLIEGRHFLPGVDPRSLGHKALAVNLSDLAAMGARPLACLLALSVPAVDHAWLEGFSAGFHALSDTHGCPLVGGDTTRSLDGIIITVTVLGDVEPAAALRRSNARAGDDIWLSGTLGAAWLALQLLQKQLPADDARLQASRQAMDFPMPQIALGCGLAGLAHAAIDVSDGLLQDLGHVLQASQCGAELWLEALPAHDALHGLDETVRRQAMLAGGDVYELCFTAGSTGREAIMALGKTLGLKLSRIGRIVPDAGLRLFDAQGNEVSSDSQGFDHFAASEPSA